MGELKFLIYKFQVGCAVVEDNGLHVSRDVVQSSLYVSTQMGSEILSESQTAGLATRKR